MADFHVAEDALGGDGLDDDAAEPKDGDDDEDDPSKRIIHVPPGDAADLHDICCGNDDALDEALVVKAWERELAPAPEAVPHEHGHELDDLADDAHRWRDQMASLLNATLPLKQFTGERPGADPGGRGGERRAGDEDGESRRGPARAGESRRGPQGRSGRNGGLSRRNTFYWEAFSLYAEHCGRLVLGTYPLGRGPYCRECVGSATSNTRARRRNPFYRQARWCFNQHWGFAVVIGWRRLHYEATEGRSG